MKYHSTRGHNLISFSEAALKGLADDGGLFVPEHFPQISKNDFSPEDSLAITAQKLLKHFLADDPLENELEIICQNAFNFEAPLTSLNETISLLELFHGPTAAFKDFGARFLAECFSRLKLDQKITILVATSGDTGGAIASAFNEKSGVEVGILFPKDKVSPFQKHQLCCWEKNIRSFEVLGTFDDCQALVKKAFQSKSWTKNTKLTSANSINIGRLLPQMVYYVHTCLKKPDASYIIPTGNLGNAVAAFWAKKMGFPIGNIILASNANKVIPDYFETQKWEPRPSITTLANAMDVGNPSNMERLLNLYPDKSKLFQEAKSFSVSDIQIKDTIINHHKQNGRICCPHTATALFVAQKLKQRNTIVVATAHPAKFMDVISPLIKDEITMPDALNMILKKKIHFEEISPNLVSLLQKML